MRERLRERLEKGFGGRLKIHGPRDPASRLPNTLSVGVSGLDARAFLDKVGGKGSETRGLVHGRDEVGAVPGFFVLVRMGLGSRRWTEEGIGPSEGPMGGVDPILGRTV